MKKSFLVFIIMTVLAYTVHSQSTTHIPTISIESGAVISTGKHAPFWFYSNQYGKISTKNNSIYLLPSVFRDFKKDSKIDYRYNISPLLRYDGSGKAYMHQWFGEVKFHFIHFTAGAKEEFYGNQDSTLSTGFILWSKNARPMPKLTIGVPNYTPVPFTWKLLEFKGGMSHGWFDGNEFNENVWLHHKYFYLRLGGKLPVHISYGLHHFAQWGGTNYDPYGELPHDMKAFKSVFKGGGGYEPDPNIPWTEWANRIGNHIGSRNFGLEVDFSKTKVSIYWQNIFEDGSGKAYRNIKDGLFGISIKSNEKNKIINGLVYEFFNTTDQSGRVNEIDSIDLSTGRNYELGGNDNYLNSGIYLKGWTFNGMGLGNALITSPEILKGDQVDYLRNNKVIAHHIGVEGKVQSIDYKFMYTYSINYGTNYFPFAQEITQHSILVTAGIPKKLAWDLHLSCSLGADFGKMYGDNFGMMFSLKKEFKRN